MGEQNEIKAAQRSPVQRRCPMLCYEGDLVQGAPLLQDGSSLSGDFPFQELLVGHRVVCSPFPPHHESSQVLGMERGHIHTSSTPHLYTISPPRPHVALTPLLKAPGVCGFELLCIQSIVPHLYDFIYLFFFATV